jgi:hypothetical protein
MITQPSHRYNTHIGADDLQLLSEETHIDLDVVFHGFRIVAPYPGENNLF